MPGLDALDRLLSDTLPIGTQLTLGIVVVAASLLVIGHALWGRR